MDDIGGTFFDLASSSPSYPLCSGSTLSNNIGSISSSSGIGEGNFLQEQVTDLDAMLLSDTDFTGHVGLSNNHHLNLSNHSSITVRTESKSSFLSDYYAPSYASENSNENVPSADNTELSLDYIMGDSNDSLVHSQLHTGNSNPAAVTLNGSVASSNMVQVKLSKPLLIKSSQPPGRTNPSVMIPVTLHSMTGHKHTITNKTLPLSGPHAHLLPVVMRCTAESNTNRNQEANVTKPQSKLSLTDPSHLNIIVCNVVASFRVRCHLNLRQIALESIDVVYRRETQKVVMRMRKPKCTAYIWSSGKIVCTGSSSADNAKQAAKKFSRRLQRLGFKVRFDDFKIVNVLAVSKMPYAINIQDFSQFNKGKHCSYEPELHPGVTFRDSATKATLKIFSTGSVTVTGRSVERAKEAIKNLYPLLEHFYKFDKPNIDLDYDDAMPSDTEDLS